MAFGSCGSRSKLLMMAGISPLQERNPCINTRTLYAVVTNPIAWKGQGRTPLQGAGTASLLGSRGKAPWVSPRSPSIQSSQLQRRCKESVNLL